MVIISESEIKDNKDITTSETVVDEYVTIQSLFPAKLRVQGKVTGNIYVFDNAGSTVNVLKDDVDYFLQTKIGAGCCGGAGNSLPTFKLLEQEVLL